MPDSGLKLPHWLFHPLSAVEEVLPRRGATMLQQLKCWSFQAAADQFWKRIRPALRLPARDRYQQTVLWQIALKTRPNRLQRAKIVIPAHRQNQLAHGALYQEIARQGRWLMPFIPDSESPRRCWQVWQRPD